MVVSPDNSDHSLRNRAENTLDTAAVRHEKLGCVATPGATSYANSQSLIHELQVHQIELEMQNEELRLLTDDNLNAERHRAMIATELFGYWLTDISGKLLEVNDTYCRMSGYSKEELLRLTISDLEDSESEEETARHMMQLMEFGADHFESRHRGKDGWIYCVEISTVYLRSQNRCIVFIRDISDRKIVESELHASEERYHAVIEDQTEMICRYRHDGRLTFVNEAYCRSFGKKRAELINRNYIPHIPEPDLSNVLEQLKTISPRIPIASFEHRVIMSDETICWQHWVHRGIYTCDGDVLEFQAVGRDISQRKQVEEKLAEQKRLLETLMEAMPVPVFFKDRNACYIGFNKSYEEFFGNSREDLLGKSVYDLAPRELADVYRAKDEELFLNKGSQVYESVVKDASGVMHEVIFHKAAYLGQDGEVNGLIGAILDISERKHSEEALRESREKFKAYVDNSIDVIFVLNADGVFQFISQAWERHFGYPAEVATSKNFVSFVHPDDSSICAEYLNYVLSGKNDRTSPSYRVKHADGSWRWFIANGSRYVNTNNEWQFIGVGRDITERKQTEEELRDRMCQASLGAAVGTALNSVNDLSTILKSCAEAIVLHLDAAFARIWILNENENMLELCASAGMYTHLNGPHGRVPVGMFKIGLIAQERKSHLTNNVIGDPRVSEQEWAKREGIVAFTGHPLIVADKVIGVMALFSRFVISETTTTTLAVIADGLALGIVRKQSEEDLKKAKYAADSANLAKSAFLATMSHEIRTPLNALLGNIELLAESRLSPQQRERLKDSQTASEMLLQVINDVLDFSKIESGKLELVNESFSVSEMARHLVSAFAASAEHKGLELGLSLADGVPDCLCADRHRLHQIIANLLSNAIKFTDHGKVVLEISRGTFPPLGIVGDDDKVVLRISVRDTGIGIPLKKHGTLFDSFTQVDEFNTRRHTGSGLGLAICRSLAGLMGGTISLTSAPGEGSCFTLSLPVVVCQASQRVKTRRAAASAVTTPRNILLADDEELGRIVTVALLQRRGHRVTAVENGADLLEALQREQFDIVLSDISMPDMDGVEVVRIIRSGQRDGINSRVPMIALTAHAFAEDRALFMEYGFNDTASKPVDFEGLLLLIDELCCGAGE